MGRPLAGLPQPRLGGLSPGQASPGDTSPQGAQKTHRQEVAGEAAARGSPGPSGATGWAAGSGELRPRLPPSLAGGRPLPVPSGTGGWRRRNLIQNDKKGEVTPCGGNLPVGRCREVLQVA